MTGVVRVALAGRGYDVLIGQGLLETAAESIAPLLNRPKITVVMDQTVKATQSRRLIDPLLAAGMSVEEIVIAPGEQAKNFAGLEALCTRLLDLELERGDLIVAFGGGVIGDLAGFAAAIFKRGIDFVQIPTTLLAQVDSSVGGKTAIDAPAGKNLIGAFHQPRLVLADLTCLDTLPDREMACGYGEVLKYALLGDRGFFHWLEDHGAAVLARNPQALAQAVHQCVSMKAKIVAADEREGGVRALLNLGHTFGHAIEAETGFGEALKHGEAVGLGCAMAFRFSAHLGFCTAEDASRVGTAVTNAGLPGHLDALTGHDFAAEALIRHMTQDKKAEGSALTFILARGIGASFVEKNVDRARLQQFLIAEGARP